MPAFYVFFRKTVVEEAGLDLREIRTPYHVSDCGVRGRENIYMVLVSQSGHDPRFQELKDDPDYEMVTVSGN